MSLPSGYKRLEYIESTGTQYVDTGVLPNQNTNVELDFVYTGAASTTWYPLFGVHDANNQYYFSFVNTNSNGHSFGFSTQEYYPIGTYSSARRIIAIENGSFVIDGAIVKTANPATFAAVNSMYLFALNRQGTVDSRITSMRCYSFNVEKDGSLVRHFIPSKRNSDGAIGMYDLVTKAFFENAGTGTFTAGPEVGAAMPANFRLSSSTENTATLAWDAVDGATGYKLYRDGSLISTLTETSYTDAIQPFVHYIYTLTAYNDNGESDPATISVQIIIPPETPSNFRASSASMTAISLAWDAVTGAESYQLSRDGAVIYTGLYQSYTDRGLTAETAYTYTLSAVNTAGSSAETMLEAATTQLILVTDRTAADVAAQNAKGTYNAADLNRVGEAMNYVADRLRASGYDPHISPKTDWKKEDWVDQAAQAVYLGDLAELRKQFSMMKSTPEVPPRILATGINTNDGLTHTWANDIERILEDVDALLTNISAAWFFSGDLFSGEV